MRIEFRIGMVYGMVYVWYMVWYMVWYCTLLYMVWYGTVRFGMVWYGIAYPSILVICRFISRHKTFDEPRVKVDKISNGHRRNV